MNLDDIETLEEARGVVTDSLVVALDLESRDEAVELVDVLGDRVRYYKIGHRLFSRYGPEILEEFADRDVELLLDLKLYDIPTEVERACAHLADHPAVSMTTVHASGGRAMMQAAVEGTRAHGDDDRPKVVAVTALTSMSGSMLPDIGVGLGYDDWTLQLGELALEAGVDGLVVSGRDLHRLQYDLGWEPVLITPGLRLPDIRIAGDDQRRIETPADALDAGATLLMMGRPVYQAPDPAAMIEVLTESLVEAPSEG